MAVDILFDNARILTVDSRTNGGDYNILKCLVSKITNIPECDLYATQNGRPVQDAISSDCPVRFASRICGGKGGFGSMLRAIGAQIEKTTNREACRDLSGRRLRDIREEQRLREWAASRPQRNEDAKKRKEERLKRLCAVPSHEFQDPAYEEARQKLEEVGGEAVEVGVKRAPAVTAPTLSKPQRKKPKLWIDEDLSDMSSSESSCEEDNEVAAKIVTSPLTAKGKGAGKMSKPKSDETKPDSSTEESDEVARRDSPQSSDDGIEEIDSTVENRKIFNRPSSPLVIQNMMCRSLFKF